MNLDKIKKFFKKNNYFLDEDILKNFYAAIMTKPRFVILAGPPGTGKTSFALWFAMAWEELKGVKQGKKGKQGKKYERNEDNEGFNMDIVSGRELELEEVGEVIDEIDKYVPIRVIQFNDNGTSLICIYYYVSYANYELYIDLGSLNKEEKGVGYASLDFYEVVTEGKLGEYISLKDLKPRSPHILRSADHNFVAVVWGVDKGRRDNDTYTYGNYIYDHFIVKIFKRTGSYEDTGLQEVGFFRLDSQKVDLEELYGLALGPKGYFVLSYYHEGYPRNERKLKIFKIKFDETEEDKTETKASEVREENKKEGYTDKNSDVVSGERYLLIRVRPEWTNPRDVLGYRNIKGEFVPGPIYEFLKKANKDPENLYFLILDEMNLSHPEYYLSDIISAMETSAMETGGKINKIINIDNEEIEYPENLVIVGTINRDETTQNLSPRLLSRAITIEFRTNWKLVELVENDNFLVEIFKKFDEKLKKANLGIGYREYVRAKEYIDKAKNVGYDEIKALDEYINSKIIPRIRGIREDFVKDGENVIKELIDLAQNYGLSKTKESLEKKSVLLETRGIVE